METIETRIGGASLTEKDRKILDYLLENREETCFQTSNQLAERLGVSPSSVVRLSAKLDFESFGQMRRAMQEEVLKGRKQPEAPIPYEKIKEADKLSDEQLITLIRHNITRNLEQDAKATDFARYVEAARLLSEGGRVFLIGFRACAGYAASFGTMLSCIRPGVTVLTGSQPTVDSLVDLSERDTVVAISYQRYSSDTLYAVRIAREAGSSIVAMTDSYASPIASGAKVTIVNKADSFSFYNSYAGLAANIEILVGLVSKHNKDQNEERLRRMEGYLKETGQY